MATYVDGVYIHEKGNEDKSLLLNPSGYLMVETFPSPSGNIEPQRVMSPSGTNDIPVYITNEISAEITGDVIVDQVEIVSASGTADIPVYLQNEISATNLDIRKLDESQDSFRMYSASGTTSTPIYVEDAIPVSIISRDGNYIDVDEHGHTTTHIVDEHLKPAQFSAFGIFKTASEAMIADYRFDEDTVIDEWDVTTTGAGSYSIPDSVNGLQLNTGSSSSSKVQFDSQLIHYYQSGRGQLIKMSVILGDTGVAGNIREWGYGDDDNGVFFRMDGTTLKAVIRCGGSEVSINSSDWDVPVTPDQYGHLYYIQFEWLGVGNVFFYYDEQIVHTYRFLGTSTDFTMQTPDLPMRYRNENTTNTTDVYMKMGCASVVAEGGLILSGRDPDGVVRQAAMTRAGQLSVSTPPPEAPVGTTSIIQTEYDDVSVVHDNEYVLPSGSTVVVNRLSGGSEVGNGGSVVELWYDPEADMGANAEIMDAIHCDGNTDQHDLSASYTGDGRKRIVMRRKRYGGGAVEVFARWEGYY